MCVNNWLAEKKSQRPQQGSDVTRGSCHRTHPHPPIMDLIRGRRNSIWLLIIISGMDDLIPAYGMSSSRFLRAEDISWTSTITSSQLSLTLRIPGRSCTDGAGGPHLILGTGTMAVTSRGCESVLFFCSSSSELTGERLLSAGWVNSRL